MHLCIASVDSISLDINMNYLYRDVPISNNEGPNSTSKCDTL